MPMNTAWRRLVYDRLLPLVIVLLGTMVAAEALRGALSLPTGAILPWAWIAWLAAVAATLPRLRTRAAVSSAACLYWLGLIGIGLVSAQRGYWPGRFFVWGALCDLAGFALVSALVGWSWPAVRSFQPRLVFDRPGPTQVWFSCAQAGLIGVTAVLTAWTALDLSLEGMGRDVALFGLAGRAAAGAAALMLVGACILMAWQSGGVWRRRWQYAAMAAGVLFTASVGWSRIDPELGADPGRIWLARIRTLLLSTAMMTLLTRVGLSRVLPAGSDWIARGRRAASYFAGAALLLLILMLSLLIVAACRNGQAIVFARALI